METICDSLDEYLQALREQCRMHGRSTLQGADNPQTYLVGFRSPAGTWFLRISTLKFAFSEGDLKRAPTLEAKYGPKVRAFSRQRLPDDVCVALFTKLCQEALEPTVPV